MDCLWENCSSGDRGNIDEAGYDSDATVTYPFPSALFMPGDIVRVAPRTWPGVNRLGGVGKVLSVDETADTASVKYLIGRKRTEHDVHFEYIENYDLGPRDKREVRSSVTSQVQGRGVTGGVWLKPNFFLYLIHFRKKICIKKNHSGRGGSKF